MTSGKYVSEEELNEKAVAPRVTLEALEANIVGTHYFSPFDGVMGERFHQFRGELPDEVGTAIPQHLKLTTYCILTLKNGFTVTGMSACASPENYDEDIGRRVARGDAIRQCWALLGFELRSKLARIEQIGHRDYDLGEALTRMTAVTLGNPEAFRRADADTILAHFDTDQSEEGGETTTAEHISDAKLAQLCHEINRAWCEKNGDHSQLAWADAPDWQRESAINGVQFHRSNPGAGPEQSHANWLIEKEKDGWMYGVEKDVDAKLHPCMVPYDQLPELQQFKDKLFTTLIHTADTPSDH